jgi:hypothetical protein
MRSWLGENSLKKGIGDALAAKQNVLKFLDHISKYFSYFLSTLEDQTLLPDVFVAL